VGEGERLHTGGVATFAHGGKLSRPYGILDITMARRSIYYRGARYTSACPPRLGGAPALTDTSTMFHITLPDNLANLKQDFRHSNTQRLNMPSSEILERFISRVEQNAHTEAVEEYIFCEGRQLYAQCDRCRRRVPLDLSRFPQISIT
jgi:hypothetical protein